jgi:hypothetical protein
MLDDWLQEAAAALEATPADKAVLGEEAVQILLGLARDAAHGVARPAAPLGTFALGLALGSSGGGMDDLRRFARRLTDLADAWEADPSPS